MQHYFLVDESLSPILAHELRQLGYNAISIREINLKGADDTKIIEWSIKNNAIIIAGDLDFGELWFWHYSGKVGVIVLRVKSYTLEKQFEVIIFLHENNVLTNEKIKNSLVISTHNKYRLRTI